MSRAGCEDDISGLRLYPARKGGDSAAAREHSKELGHGCLRRG